jgi:hypothetical protein
MFTAAEERNQSFHELTLHRLKEMLKIGLCLTVFLFSYACTVADLSTQPAPEAANFLLFLQPLPQESHRLSFTINELFALREDGTELPLIMQQSTFQADSLIGVQKKLVSITLPQGRYLGLKLIIEKASLNGEEGEVALLPPTDPISVDHAFSIVEKQSESLQLSLSPDRLVTNGAFFTPKFTLWKPERMLRNLKGFVSNGGAQSLTVFNKKTAQVTDFIQIGKRPRDIALDQRRGWLYVALAGDDLIAVVEVSNGEILGQIRLRFGDEPTELALSASGNRLLALNRGSSSVSIIDAGSLFELGRVRLDSDASDVFVGRKEDRAYVIQPASSSLSVLDLEAFRVLNSITLSDVPLEGVVSSDDKTLYLTTDFSSELLVVDSASLRVKEKIFVGSGARSIKRHGVSGLLYVGKQNGEVAVVDPKVLMAIDSYSLPGPIQSLAIDIEENALFAVIPKSGRLLKLDLVSKRPVGLLELGAESYSVVVMGER